MESLIYIVLFGALIVGAVFGVRAGLNAAPKKRSEFILPWIGYIVLNGLVNFGSRQISGAGSWEVGLAVAVLGGAAVHYFFGKIVAQRCKDAGFAPGVAYPAAIPGIGFLFSIVMLFWPSKKIIGAARPLK